MRRAHCKTIHQESGARREKRRNRSIRSLFKEFLRVVVRRLKTITLHAHPVPKAVKKAYQLASLNLAPTRIADASRSHFAPSVE